MKTYQFKINGNEYKVDINAVDGQEMTMEVNGQKYNVTVETELEKKPVIARPQVNSQVSAATSGEVQRSSKPKTAGNNIIAPLPGTILDVLVNAGDQVKEGQTVCILEAMKMENSIEADCAGTIKEIRVRKGDVVAEGDILVVIA